MTLTSLTNYAGFRRRFLAWLIDDVIFLLLATALGFMVFGKHYFQGPNEQAIFDAFTTQDYRALFSEVSKESSVAMLDSFTDHFLPAVITVWCWIKFMATPGKLLMSCHVVDAKTGNRISVLQAILRYFGYIISLLSLCLGFLWIIWDKRKQGFHDKIAGTVVIQDADDLSQYSLSELAEQA